MQSVFASKTVDGLSQLIKYIDSNVLIRVWFIIPASILSGFLDFAAVAVIGRLTGSLVGSNLGNLLPGIKVFGASLYEQSLWLIAIFIIVNWLQSIVRLALRLMQENLAGELWLDLSGRIFRQILAQPYESHLLEALHLLPLIYCLILRHCSKIYLLPH